jgi:hypothetical protein
MCGKWENTRKSLQAVKCIVNTVSESNAVFPKIIKMELIDTHSLRGRNRVLWGKEKEGKKGKGEKFKRIIVGLGFLRCDSYGCNPVKLVYIQQ